MKCWKTIFMGLAVVLSCALFTPAQAQGYPSKPIRVLVGFAAGGAADAAARIVAPGLSNRLGQTVVVENRLGAGGSVATETVFKSLPDGYTLLLVASADAIQPAMRAKMPYDLPGDFSPISLLATGPFVMVVHPSVPAKSVKEVIALAQARPGALNYASSGVGSSAHFAGELFNSLAKVKITHIPYKGAALSAVAVASGEADLSINSIIATQSLINASRLRALAVSSAKRTLLLPNLPTLNESGVPGYDRVVWLGLAGPAGLTEQIVGRLNAAAVETVNAPAMQPFFLKQGLEPQANSPQQFVEFIRRDVQETLNLARAAGIEPK